MDAAVVTSCGNGCVNGVVECWNPDGPCEQPNRLDCETCGRCNICASLLDPVPARIVAEALGVSGNQIYMWHQRRDKNGFPPAIAQIHIPTGSGVNRGAPLYDLDAVIAWHRTYDVKKQLATYHRRNRHA